MDIERKKEKEIEKEILDIMSTINEMETNTANQMNAPSQPSELAQTQKDLQISNNNNINFLNEFSGDKSKQFLVEQVVDNLSTVAKNEKDRENFLKLAPLVSRHKYKSHYKVMCEGLLRDGTPFKELPKILGIPELVFHLWRKAIPGFEDSLQRGSAPVNYLVENALLKLALGYTSIDITIDEKNVNGKIVPLQKVSRREIAPNLGAIQTYLINQNGVKWKLRPEVPDIESKLEQLLAKFNSVEQIGNSSISKIPDEIIDNININIDNTRAKKPRGLLYEDINWNSKQSTVKTSTINNDEIDSDYTPIAEDAILETGVDLINDDNDEE